jgi:ribosome-associated protein
MRPTWPERRRRRGSTSTPACTPARQPRFAPDAPGCRKRIEESPIEPKTSARPDPETLLGIVTDILDDRKAGDVVVIDLAGKSTIADYMVVATGQSSRQVSALGQHLLQAIKKQGLVGITPEGVRQGDWVLIDAGDVIVHLFRPEVREFYNLEKRWGASHEGSDQSSGANL